MSGKQQVHNALRLASKTCSVALEVLQDKSPEVEQSSSEQVVSLDTLVTDFKSLLSLLYHDATKLSLILKPDKPAYLASLTLLEDLILHVDAFASCACRIKGTIYGQTFTKEVRWSAEDVIGTFISLFASLTANVENSESSQDQVYLIRIGAVHESIERARQIPQNNLEAVRKRWTADVDGVNDCVNEIQEMIEDEGTDVDDEDSSSLDGIGSEDDDDWGDPATKSSTSKSIKATAEELSRLKSIQRLLKLMQALQKRVLLSLLCPTSSFNVPSHIVDQLLSYSNDLLRNTDDLVSSLYLPHDLEAISRRLDASKSVIENLRDALIPLELVTPLTLQGNMMDDLIHKSTHLNLQSNNLEEKLVKERRWFNTCFLQINKSFGTALE